MSQKGISQITFDNKVLPESQIFLTRKNVFGMINKNACTQGHVLICSRRVVASLSELTEIQTIDLFMTAKQAQKKLSVIHNCQYKLTIKNGKFAGQTVPHCHIHVYPSHQQLNIHWDNKTRSESQLAKQCLNYQGMFELGVQ